MENSTAVIFVIISMIFLIFFGTYTSKILVFILGRLFSIIGKAISDLCKIFYKFYEKQYNNYALIRNISSYIKIKIKKFFDFCEDIYTFLEGLGYLIAIIIIPVGLIILIVKLVKYAWYF